MQRIKESCCIFGFVRHLVTLIAFPLAIKGGQAYYRTFGKYDKLKGRNLPMLWSLEVGVLPVLVSPLLGLSI